MNKKNIFVAASITGGRGDLPFVKAIVAFLQAEGHEVPSVHNAGDDPTQTFVEKIQDPTATDNHSFRKWDNRWIDEADLFIAEVTTRSHGVGGEFEHCRLKPRMDLNRTPMLAVYRSGVEVSPYLTGISDDEKSYMWFRSYDTVEDLLAIVTEFIAAF